MNKGGYSTPPQYRSGDYRYPPGPSRYQPYHPPPDRVYDSRQRPVMQNDYYPEVNYPSPRQGRPEMPPSRDEISFSRGRGRERDFNGQYNRPSPGPPPISPQFSRDYPHRFPHPPPFNINNPPNNPNNNNNPMPNTPPNTPPSNNNSSNNNNNNHNSNNNNNNNTNNNNNNNNIPHNNHPNYNSPRERPPDFPVRDFHSYRQESPVKPPPSPSPLVKQNPPPNSPNLNYNPDNFPPRMIPPESNRIPNIPPQFHRSNDYPQMNPIDDMSNIPPQFPINSPPRPPIHLMALKPNPIPLPPNFHHPLNMPNPIPLNVEIETKLDTDDFRNYVQEVDLDMKKYYYDRACRKIDVVQAKLDAIMNKLSELEAEPNTPLSSSSSL